MSGPFAPCLDPELFTPDQLDVDDWFRASVAMGVREIVITAQHEGGFCLWPSSATNYTIANSPWGRQTGRDLLAEFVAGAKRWNVRVGYYFNIMCSGYTALVDKVSPERFIEVQMHKLRELLSPPYTPSRLWFDGTHSGTPHGTNLTQLWDEALPVIRAMSPSTIVSPYRGDVCYRPLTSAYGSSSPRPNSSDASGCGKQPDPTGPYFAALESHGVTMQQGVNGSAGGLPTFWFWHDEVGFGPARRLFGAYLGTAGHGKTLTLNIAPNMTGLMAPGVVGVMREFGEARNATFGTSLASMGPASGDCDDASAFVLDTSGAGVTVGDLDYVSVKEDLTRGQRIANYSIGFRTSPSGPWQVLVPAPTCLPWKDKHCANSPNCNINPLPGAGGPVGDVPSAGYPRDAFVGSRRIDCPKAAGGVALPPDGTPVDAVRFRCLATLARGEPVHLRELSVHRHSASFPAPWKAEAT